VPVDTNIVIHVNDNKDGIDLSSIKMTVQGNSVKPTTVLGDPSDYTITYDPENDFGFNQVITVTVTAQDKSNPPNVMSTDVYSFTTATENTETDSGGSSNGWVWPVVIGGIGGALLIALGTFLLMNRRKI
jgi:hypothetical protein